MKRFSLRKKIVAGAATAALVAAIGGGAYAYFTTTGSGSGSATIGSSSNLIINQASITYSNATAENAFLPGTTANVTFTVDNNASGHQQLGTISLASVTSDKAGCDSTTHSSWFSATTDVVNGDYAPGTAQAVPGSITVTFVNDTANSQDVCQGANLTLNWAA